MSDPRPTENLSELEAQQVLRERLERWRDDLEFDGDWEEYVRVCLTRLLNGQERE